MRQIMRVQQEDAFGCQIAVCAMLLGKSYSETRKLFPGDASLSGYGPHVVQSILTNNGYAVAMAWRHDASIEKDRSPWPPKPWSEVHWCQVETENGAHAVLMLQDGSILDPCSTDRVSLSDYKKVNSVAAVVPVPNLLG